MNEDAFSKERNDCGLTRVRRKRMARHNLAQAVLVLLMMRVSLHGASEADEVERCTSNRLHKFDPIVPKKRRYSDLSLCHKFAQKTCCNRTHTDGLAR